MKRTTRKVPGLWALIAVLALGACDSPTGEEDDHGGEVEGIQLILNGQTIASYDGETGSWTGEMEVDEGEETAHITVRFVDHDGEAISFDDDFWLLVEIADESIAEFEQDTPGELGGHLHGIAAGETEAVFSLMHGAVNSPSAHPDFVSTAVHVHVN